MSDELFKISSEVARQFSYLTVKSDELGDSVRGVVLSQEDYDSLKERSQIKSSANRQDEDGEKVCGFFVSHSPVVAPRCCLWINDKHRAVAYTTPDGFYEED